MSPQPKPDRPSHEPWTPSLALVCSVLPATEASFRAALEHSRSAFELLDSWLGYTCVDTLQRGVPTELAQGPDATDDEYIIALCLTAALEGQRFTGIPHLKALLLLGVAEGRKEEKLLETLGDGVHKARLRGSWGQIMPRALPANATIAIVLAHCHAHAIALLNAPGERAKPEVKWLQALVRWCELLQQTKRVTARRVPPSIDLPLEDLTSDDDDAWPVPADIDIDHGLDAPDLTDEDEDEIESLLDGQSPEAAPAKLRTPPPV